MEFLELLNKVHDIAEELKNTSGLPDSVDNIRKYKIIAEFTGALKSWEMNQRKAICAKLFIDHNIKKGEKIKNQKIGNFKITATNKCTPKLDLDSMGADDIDDIEFCVDDLTKEESDCFSSVTVFDMKKFQELLKDNPDVEYPLKEFLIINEAAPELKIVEL